MEILKVSAKSSPNSVAGALAGVIREKGKAEMQDIGAGAVNQAIKAVAISRGFVASSGIDSVCIPLLLISKRMGGDGHKTNHKTVKISSSECRQLSIFSLNVMCFSGFCSSAEVVRGLFAEAAQNIMPEVKFASMALICESPADQHKQERAATYAEHGKSVSIAQRVSPAPRATG